MKINPILFLFVFLPTAGIGLARGQGQPVPTTPRLTLSTPAFADGSVIPNKFTLADPKPVSPKLEWTNVPPNTASFVLLVIDLDSAMQKTTEEEVHWLAFNIPGTSRELPEGLPVTPQLPDGSTQVKNGHGFPGYLGMGAHAVGPYHHYTFELFALDTELQLGPDATRADVSKAMDGHILAKAVMVGRFHR